MSDKGRLLFVHAHPDDETIGSGVTMARYAEQGHHVTLVTSNLGEEGEIVVPELEHLAAAADDDLGPHREVELADAMKALGVSDHRLLGGAGRYRDSGMMGEPTNDNPQCFWKADLTEASADLVSVIREVRPHVIVTYDEFGGYGHPDHIQAHRVAMYGMLLAAAPSFRPELGEAWDIPKAYWTAYPRSVVRRGREVMKAKGLSFFGAADDSDDPDIDGVPWGCDDALVTSVVTAIDQEPKKLAAMHAHVSQIRKEAPFFMIAEVVGPGALGTEHYRLVKGTVAGPFDADGRETDLLAGVV